MILYGKPLGNQISPVVVEDKRNLQICVEAEKLCMETHSREHDVTKICEMLFNQCISGKKGPFLTKKCNLILFCVDDFPEVRFFLYGRTADFLIIILSFDFWLG
jgi:hypothetical protein